MPTISRFFGIVVQMYDLDHNPPHFHVSYNEYTAIIDIEGLWILQGKLPPRVHSLVIEWANIHKQELQSNRESMERHDRIVPIAPLE